MNIKKLKHKIYLEKELIHSSIQYLFSKKRKMKIRIISSRKWKNKCGEDVLICSYLRKLGIDTKIIAFEDMQVCPDAFYVIKSIWGYQEKQELFSKYLKLLEVNKIKVINPLDIIRNNIDKEKQYQLFLKYDIPHIKSFFLENNSSLTENIKRLLEEEFYGKKVVVKPSISASGNHTFILNGNGKNSIKIEDIEKHFHFLDGDNKLILQEYIEGVKDGELSVIYFNKKFSHAIKRYPMVFTEKNSMKQSKQVDTKVMILCDKIVNIPELKKAFCARFDFVKNGLDDYIMEIEYTDPQLFLNIGCSKDTTRINVRRYCLELVNYIEKM